MLFSLLRNAYWRRRRYLKFVKHNERHFLIGLGKTALALFFLIIAHSFAIAYIENLPLNDAIWLSITTVTTVGYGDYSATTTAGRIVTAICLYGIGISLLAQLAGEFFDYRTLARDRKITGRWRWEKMKDHLLIINTPNNDTVNYLTKLITEVRVSPEIQDMPIQILTRKFEQGLPSHLSQKGVVHYSGVAESNDNLNAVNVKTARYIILIAREADDPMSDSLTFDILSRIKEIGSEAMIIVEATQDINRQRMRNAGADVIIRPVRAYPELIVRSIVAPGTEEVLENMFTHKNDHMVRLNMEFSELIWSDVICRFVKAGIGIPMAFIGESGININPLPEAVCTGTGIITLINDTQKVTVAQAQHCLS
ncbi:MAG: ion channel [Proteobacteria bacterium]|nr:ion channel [Pseudomonadota bacterium]